MAHFCVVVVVGLLGVVATFFRWGGFLGGIGNALLNMMLWMVCSSVLYSLSCRLYVLSLLYRYLIAAYLCWAGWLEEYGMI